MQCKECKIPSVSKAFASSLSIEHIMDTAGRTVESTLSKIHKNELIKNNHATTVFILSAKKIFTKTVSYFLVHMCCYCYSTS